MSLLLLGKVAPRVDITLILPRLIKVYNEVLEALYAEGVTDVHG